MDERLSQTGMDHRYLQKPLVRWIDSLEQFSIFVYVNRGNLGNLNRTNASDLIAEGLACSVNVTWLPIDYTSDMGAVSSVDWNTLSDGDWPRVKITEGWAQQLIPESSKRTLLCWTTSRRQHYIRWKSEKNMPDNRLTSWCFLNCM